MILRTFMRAKIHGPSVTAKNLHYTGSLEIDSRLLEASGIRSNEKIQVVNLANGERMWTYALAAKAGSGAIVLNGGMAHRGEIGDRLLIITYALVTEDSLPEGIQSPIESHVVVVDDPRNLEYELRRS